MQSRKFTGFRRCHQGFRRLYSESRAVSSRPQILPHSGWRALFFTIHRPLVRTPPSVFPSLPVLSHAPWSPTQRPQNALCWHPSRRRRWRHGTVSVRPRFSNFRSSCSLSSCALCARAILRGWQGPCLRSAALARTLTKLWPHCWPSCIPSVVESVSSCLPRRRCID